MNDDDLREALRRTDPPPLTEAQVEASLERVLSATRDHEVPVPANTPFFRRTARMGSLAAALAAGLLVGVLIPDLALPGKKGGSVAELGYVQVSDEALSPIPVVRVDVGAGLRPRVKAPANLQVEWGGVDAARSGRLALWWVARDGAISGVHGADPVAEPAGTTRVEVAVPAGAQALVVAVLTGPVRSVPELATELGDGTTPRAGPLGAVRLVVIEIEPAR